MPNRTIPARDPWYQQPGYLRKKIVFGDSGTAVTVGVVPAGAIIIDAGVIVSTVFNAGTTNTLDIGTSADADGLASAIALGTKGRIVADDLATSDDLGPFTADTTITATPATSGTAATTGEGEVYVTFLARR